ncbi:MAG TPA: hypothetical protein VME42_19285 [Steroidobacteraceae bacterium]|nr:hypothetical protein [Steroidobacteraceae bacterium]
MHWVLAATLICIFSVLLLAGLVSVLRDMLRRDLHATASALPDPPGEERRKGHRYGISIAVPSRNSGVPR